MAAHNDLGQDGEKLALHYLISSGFTVLETNYKFSYAEVDIIARKERLLIFVEVKSRSNLSFGLPESFVSERQMELLMDAAYHYMEKINHHWEIRFDVISIWYRKSNTPKLNHIKDAFVP